MARMNVTLAPRVARIPFSLEKMNEPEKLRQEGEERRLNILAKKAQLHQATQAEDRRSKLGGIYARAQRGDLGAKYDLQTQYPEEAMRLAGQQRDDERQDRAAEATRRQREVLNKRAVDKTEREIATANEVKETAWISSGIRAVWQSQDIAGSYDRFLNEGEKRGYNSELIAELRAMGHEDPRSRNLMIDFYNAGPDAAVSIDRLDDSKHFMTDYRNMGRTPTALGKAFVEGAKAKMLLPSERNDADQQVRNATVASGMLTAIIEATEKGDINLGAGAAVDLFTTEALGVIFQAAGAGLATIPKSIRAITGGDVRDMLPRATALGDYMDNVSARFFDENLSKLTVAEQKLIYALARSRKGTDRLAIKDIENAEKSVGLLKYFASEEKTLASLKAIRNELLSDADYQNRRLRVSARHGQDTITGFPVNDAQTASREDSNYVLVNRKPVEVEAEGEDGTIKKTGKWRFSGDAIERPFWVDPVSFEEMLSTGRLQRDSIIFDAPSPSGPPSPSGSPSALLENYRNSGANE